MGRGRVGLGMTHCPLCQSSQVTTCEYTAGSTYMECCNCDFEGSIEHDDTQAIRCYFPISRARTSADILARLLHLPARGSQHDLPRMESVPA